MVTSQFPPGLGWRELAPDEPVLPSCLPVIEASNGKRYVHESQIPNGSKLQVRLERSRPAL